MKSKTSLFNKTIFLNFLRRYWVMWVGYAGVLLVSLVLPLVNSLQSNTRYFRYAEKAGVTDLLTNGIGVALIVSLLAAAVVAAILYSYLYTPRHTGMMNALPVKREAMYLSVFAAGFVGMLIGDVVAILCCLAAEAVYGQVCVSALGILLLVLVLENLMFLGFAACCCMLTGNVFAGPAVYLIFNFTAPVVETLVKNILNAIVYGAPSGVTLRTQWLSPVLQLQADLYLDTTIIRDTDTNVVTYFDWHIEGLGVLAIYCVVGAAFALLGLLLYKRRHMETAGDVVAIPVLKPVFKVCASLCGALCFTLLVSNLMYNVELYGTVKMVFLALLMIVGGIVGWFIAQMLVEKSLRVFRHGWKGVGIMSLIFVVVLCAAEFDWTGYEKRVPDGEDVQSVYIDCSGVDAGTFEEPQNIAAILQLHQNIINHKQFHELAQENNADCRYLNLNYTMTDGSTMKRRYYLSAEPSQYLDSNSDMRTLEAIVNTREAVYDRYLLDETLTPENVNYCHIEYLNKEIGEYSNYYDLTPSQIAELYNDYIVPDVQAGNLGYIHLLEDNIYAREKYDCQIYLELMFPVEEVGTDGSYITRSEQIYSYKSMNIYLSVSAEHTLGYLKELGIEPVTIEEAAKMSGVSRYTETGYEYLGEEYSKEYYENYVGDSAVTRETATAVIIN